MYVGSEDQNVYAINAATGTNGGYTATNAAGVLTYTAPTAFGDTVNTLYPIAAIVGTITTSHTAFTGGVSALMAMDNAPFIGCNPPSKDNSPMIK